MFLSTHAFGEPSSSTKINALVLLPSPHIMLYVLCAHKIFLPTTPTRTRPTTHNSLCVNALLYRGNDFDTRVTNKNPVVSPTYSYFVGTFPTLFLGHLALLEKSFFFLALGSPQLLDPLGKKVEVSY